MDFDSSSKFISSLAKFLQSLCNGYVEFNSGVEVIGHIYLSVDTGKKIDYILNEKVCKTDENSVTFISNSFHAQPAEKPKPPVKTTSTSEPVKSTDSKNDDDIIIMDEPESKNVGTIPQTNNFHSQLSSSSHKINRPSKRSFNQSFSSNHRHFAKQSRNNISASSNGNQIDTDSIHSESNSSHFLPPQLANDTTIMAATESDLTHLSKVFPETFSDSTNNQSVTEERDIKPQLDNDLQIVQVKQEYETGHGGDDESEAFDDPQEQKTQFPSMPYDQYYAEEVKRGQRSDYGMSQNEYFPHGAAGDTVSGDSSDEPTGSHLWCQACGKHLQSRRHYKDHINSVHFKQLPYACNMCERRFGYKSNMARHKMKAHFFGSTLLTRSEKKASGTKSEHSS